MKLWKKIEISGSHGREGVGVGFQSSEDGSSMILRNVSIHLNSTRLYDWEDQDRYLHERRPMWL
jgi:hypothetical protein